MARTGCDETFRPPSPSISPRNVFRARGTRPIFKDFDNAASRLSYQPGTEPCHGEQSSNERRELHRLIEEGASFPGNGALEKLSWGTTIQASTLILRLKSL